ncbi:putative thiopurine S-methyltransferase [Glandiceps talaboti]
MMSEEKLKDTALLQEQEADVLDPDLWDERWRKGRTGFHLQNVHKLLISYLDVLTNGRKGIKIFFPLCGKTMDMKWLADQGYYVTGLEYSKLAIETFFEENCMEYSKQCVDNIKDCVLYKSEDGFITIYQCDFFNISGALIGQFDAIWDRAAFVAIMTKERQKYRDVVVSLMKPDTRYLLGTVNYDTTVTTAPPYSISNEVVKELYGDRCNIETITEHDGLSEFWIKKGHKYWTEILHSITLKS